MPAVIKTDRDMIVHQRSNGDFWVYERGLPTFWKSRQLHEQVKSVKASPAKAAKSAKVRGKVKAEA